MRTRDDLSAARRLGAQARSLRRCVLEEPARVSARYVRVRMPRARSWLTTVLAGVLLACSSGAPDTREGATAEATPTPRPPEPVPGYVPPPPPESPPLVDPPAAPAAPVGAPHAPTAPDLASAQCALGEPAVLGETADRRPKMVATLDAAGGLAAWTVDAEHVNVVSLDAMGAPRGAATLVPMPGARDLFGVYRVGDGHVLATHPICAPGSIKCLELLAFDAQGTAVGEPFSHRVGEWIVGHHVRVEGRALTLLRSHTYRPMTVERYVLGEGGAFTVETLATFEFGEEEAPDAVALGLAVDGARWAALGEADVSAGRRRRLYVAGGTGVTVRGVLPATAVTDLRFEGDALRVVFGAEGRRPARVATLATDGTMERARELGADEALPPGTTTPHVERQSGGAYALVWRDLAGRAVGSPVVVGDRVLEARGADGVAVVYGLDGPRSGAQATVRVLRCR
ncbi:MAG: hypothetical protein H6726_04000 [Sandaracinaceae bacterium]|nr:hypothetical protein [Myxococcales bacterium]MCB9656790.1 hypothetical protein [Sandaracinaceae bacterium]